MTSSFWNVVNKIIKESDIVIQVLDARFPEETRNLEIEDKVIAKGKPIIYVQNKVDMVGRKEKKTLKVGYQVMVSSKENLGTTKLRGIIRMLKKDKTGITVGVLGYPNTGKSSLINALKQRKSASTSPKAGHTLGVQKLKIGPGIYLLDSPGVYPYKEDNESKLAMINCINPGDIDEPDLVAVELIQLYSPRICKFYGVTSTLDPEEVLERITTRLNLYKKGSILDIDRASRQIISDWQRGNIGK